MGGDFRPSDGDWTCPDEQCGNVNFARRLACNRCGKEKKLDRKKKQGIEIGSAAAEKSKGLFAAEDWQCNKCGNVNWARRTTCNVCNGPKFVEVEERTGLGGGFDERGIVEYKDRVPSDDEYDDFGRLKKKKGGANGKMQPKPQETFAVEDDEEEEEEDEDEDEDEDGEDVSKYDLWGDDDDEVKVTEEKKEISKTVLKPSVKPKEKSRSRSREKNKSSRRSRSRSREKKKSSRRSRSSSSSSSSSSSRSRSRGKRSRRGKSRRSKSRSSRRGRGGRHSSSSRSRSRSGRRRRSRSRSRSRGKKKRSRRSRSSSSSSRSRSRTRRRSGGRRDRSRDRRK